MSIGSIKDPDIFARGQLPRALRPLLRILLRFKGRRQIGIVLSVVADLLVILNVCLYAYLTCSAVSMCLGWLIYPPFFLIVGGIGGFLVWQTKDVRHQLKLVADGLKASDAKAILARDPRPPILYLRSFSNELTYSGTDEMDWPINTIGKNVGPIIAIGQPDEILPPKGIARIYLDSAADWKGVVKGLLEKARFVIISPQSTSSLVWEAVTTFEMCSPEKIIFSRPRLNLPANVFDDFRRALALEAQSRGTQIELPEEFEAKFLYFDGEMRPRFSQSLVDLLSERGFDLSSAQFERTASDLASRIRLLDVLWVLVLIYAFLFPFAVRLFVEDACPGYRPDGRGWRSKSFPTLDEFDGKR